MRRSRSIWAKEETGRGNLIYEEALFTQTGLAASQTEKIVSSPMAEVIFYRR